MAEFTYEITKSIGVLSRNEKTGWEKQLNLVSWNKAAPKYDIRDWSPIDENGNRKMGKGVTLTEEEFIRLKNLV